MISNTQRAFLAAYEECGSITDAAAAAGISRDLHYRWIKEPEYKDEFAIAEQVYGDLYEGRARRLAQLGVDEPIVKDGAVVGTRVKYLQTLMIRILEGAKPEKYRHNHQVEHTGAVAIVERLQAGRKRAAQRTNDPSPTATGTDA